MVGSNGLSLRDRSWDDPAVRYKHKNSHIDAQGGNHE